jgi:hypothetical protein
MDSRTPDAGSGACAADGKVRLPPSFFDLSGAEGTQDDRWLCDADVRADSGHPGRWRPTSEDQRLFSKGRTMGMVCWLLGHFAGGHSHAYGIAFATCARCGTELFRFEDARQRSPDRREHRLGKNLFARLAPPRRHAKPRASSGHPLRLPERAAPPQNPAAAAPTVKQAPARAYRRWWLPLHGRSAPGGRK